MIGEELIEVVKKNMVFWLLGLDLRKYQTIFLLPTKAVIHAYDWYQEKLWKKLMEIFILTTHISFSEQ